ncbi:MAG: Gldg family protein [Clostridia bacterium]
MQKKQKNNNLPDRKEPKTGSLFKRRINYGIGYILLIAAVLIVFIVVNVLLEKLPMSVDLTANEQFSITDETKEILNSLTEDVEIIALYDRVKGMADTQKAEVIRILDLYDAYSHVNVSYVSLDSNPNIINDTVGQASAAAYAEGDYIVKSGKRTKRIPANDMFETDTQYISNIIPVTYATGNQTELKVSTAIKYVTLESIPNLYVSTGLQETEMSAFGKIFEDLDNMNILVKELNLAQVDKIPEDAGAIVFLSPKRDLSEVEYDMLHQWLTFEGGMAFFAFDSDRTGVNFDRFNQLLSGLYGLSINNDIVSDEEAYQIAAAAKSSVITASSQKNGPLSVNSLPKSYFSYDSRSINVLSTVGYFESHPLIQTSSSATSTAYGSGTETKGVATLGACGDYYGDGKNSRVVVLGSSLGLTDENIQKYSDTSSELLFLYSVDWMMGEDAMDSLNIETKQYSTTVLTVDNVKSKWIFAFSVVIYPLAIIAVGVVIWLRRRHL